MIKCLIYCTKAKPYLRNYPFDLTNSVFQLTDDSFNALNGKIVAQFDCEKVEKFDVPYPAYFWEVKDELEHITKGSCLSLMSLHHYLKNDSGYAIHISNLKIFDEPYNVDECNQCRKWNTRLKNAPQNMCEVYGKDGSYYILISIKPEWVCKILNGEKNIEIRKSITKELKGLILNE